MAAKNNAKAAHFRRQGNELYGRKEFTDALGKYNESICWAENDSEDLAIGYANRSAVFLEMWEYEFALANIALAKCHNCPQRLMSKLETREHACRHELSKRKSSSQEYPEYRLEVNVEVNPRIPFLANDVHVEKTANVGRRVVADTDFEAGDVILQSQILFGSLDPSEQYLTCDFCVNDFLHSLIPCPHCVSAMYCGEDCRQKGWKHFHRFECGIAGELHDAFEHTRMPSMGPRLFFYGLSLFDDDVRKMQQFCKTHPRTGSNPFNLDYVNYDPLEEFKVIHTYKMKQTFPSQHEVKRWKVAAEAYSRAFQANALVRSLFTTNAAKKFMQHSFFDYTQAFSMNTDGGTKKLVCSAIAMIFGNNCSMAGNMALLSCGNHFTAVVLEPVSKGSQLIIKVLNDDDLTASLMIPGAFDPCREFPLMEWMVVEEFLMDDTISSTIKIAQVQNFLRRYSYMTGLRQFKRVTYMYFHCLSKIHNKQVLNDMRTKVIR